MLNSKLTKLTVDIPSSTRPLSSIKTSPPRWSTLEFKFYYVVFVLVIPVMVWISVSLSMPSHPNYRAYRPRLSSGWLFGREIDNSDAQYRSFRNNLPLLGLAALFHLAAKSLWTRLAPKRTPPNLIPFNLSLSILAMFALHGTSTFKIGTILALNYVIAKRWCGAGTKSNLGPLLTWIFNAAVLFANEIYKGYRFASISQHLEFLDKFEGVYPRWHIIFNITMLRLISFNMDYFWACGNLTDVTGLGDRTLTEKERQSRAHPLEIYTFANYVAYVLYLPLYIAGPIMTFNDFMWQQHRPLNISSPAIRSYATRFVVCLLTMEFTLHFMYVVAIKDKKAWGGYTPAEISMVGFWNLIIVWLKLLIPWRFFRLWALMDGVDPPENMVRCMANNYSTLGFWRSWHRSYNLWIIRYIYVPLGGTRNLFLNSLLVFSFVALWHDLTFRLLAWGWLVSLFIAPELLARYLLPVNKYRKEGWYRHVCGLGAVANILMMMGANLVGFVIGLEGLQFFVQELLGTIQGVRYLIFAISCLFVGVQVMFEYREEELRNGIYRRC
ncbi:hypothetical protein AMATHDRAFT_82449 [Amanita thiersii Skay4041]|uniref:MBOAT-domain-containing protein n=1 Tax=Amanita thiersii Skay4041 TaxID=703135 RepID=A0A2A9NET2_9AGAR|nr:hypothetical protein AMATHDRAFT_82449 [Amanita thiersii Skay4041]